MVFRYQKMIDKRSLSVLEPTLSNQHPNLPHAAASHLLAETTCCACALSTPRSTRPSTNHQCFYFSPMISIFRSTHNFTHMTSAHAPPAPRTSAGHVTKQGTGAHARVYPAATAARNASFQISFPYRDSSFFYVIYWLVLRTQRIERLGRW